MKRVQRREVREARTEIRQSAAEKAKWQAEADAQGVDLAELIRHAVNEYVESREKKPKK